MGSAGIFGGDGGAGAVSNISTDRPKAFRIENDFDVRCTPCLNFSFRNPELRMDNWLAPSPLPVGVHDEVPRC
jgi:hypothetical protein